MDAAERFRHRAKALDEDEGLEIIEAARLDPGEKLLRSLRWSSEWLSLYSEQMKEPGFRALEDERALGKAGLLAAWRRTHRSPK